MAKVYGNGEDTLMAIPISVNTSRSTPRVPTSPIPAADSLTDRAVPDPRGSRQLPEMVRISAPELETCEPSPSDFIYGGESTVNCEHQP
jgi:hypothetical protein